MILPGYNDKLYSVAKISIVVRALQAEGVAPAQALELVNLSDGDLSSPATRVSLNQIMQCYRNAIRLSRDPRIACHIGLRFHVSVLGMPGFAILSSPDFRRTVSFAATYHQLAGPTAEISFKETGDRAVWTVVPVPHPDVDATMYRFLVEHQFGVFTALHRDVMGPSFAPRELHFTYGPRSNVQALARECGIPIEFGRPENEFVFDSEWLDRAAELGCEVTYSLLVDICSQLMRELRARTGLAGKIREILLPTLARPISFDTAANRLAMTPRTLRRKLKEEQTSFQGLLDELRMEMAIKFLIETKLTIEQIALSLGFSEVTGFRRAFHRWVGQSPNAFRRRAEPSRGD